MKSTPQGYSPIPAQHSVDWIFALSILGYPIVAAVIEILDLESSRVLTVPFRGLVLAFSVIYIAAFFLRKQPFKISVFWTCWTAFWLLYLSRLFLDGRLNPRALQLSEDEYWLYSAGVSMLPAMAVGMRGGITSGISTMNRVAVLGLMGLILNIAVLYFKYGLDFSSSEVFLRAKTETFDPISLGHLSVTCIIIALCGLTMKFQAKNEPRRFLLYGLIFICGLVGLFISGSRGPALSLFVVLVVATISAGLGLKVTIMLIILGGVTTIALNPSLLDFYFVERVTTHMWEDSIRSTLLDKAFLLIAEHPFLGNGVDPMPIYPHNLIVEAFVVGGVALGSLLIVLLVISLSRAASGGNVRVPSTWVSLLFIQYAVAGMVSGSLYNSAPMWVAMSAVMVLNRGSNPSQGRQ